MSLFESSSDTAATESGQNQQTQQNRQTGESELEEARGTDLFIFASMASIAFSLYEYYVRDNAERALFVGQWPQTILALALYLRQRREN